MRGITRSVMTIAGRKLVTFCERVLAVDGGLGDEAPALEKLFEAHARRRVVFDNKDAFRNRLRRLRAALFRDIREQAHAHAFSPYSVIFTF